MPKTIVWLTILLATTIALEAATKRPKITRIANFTATVNNLDEARIFYGKVIGIPEAFITKDSAIQGDLHAFKVNDKQYVEISPSLKDESEDRLIRIGFETNNASALRDYLAEKGIQVPVKIGKDANGNKSFTVKDPDGHTVQFVEYLKDSVHGKNFGKHLAPTRISDHILHVGVTVADPAKADAFYKDILGFRLLWKGGPQDDRFSWISMMVPDGYDWIEYMVTTNKPSPQQLGVLHHYCLETQDMAKLYKTVVDRGYTPPREPAGHPRDGRLLLQMYDKNFTRTEVMVRKPTNTPCCSPNLDDFKPGAEPK